MSPWALWTAPAACRTDTPGFSRTSPHVGPLLLGPLGALPLNVETTLTAPDTSLPDTETPVVPVSAMFSVGNELAVPAAPAPPASTSAPVAATAPAVAISDVNRFDMWLEPPRLE